MLKTAAPLSNARATAADRDVIERYYDLLEDLYVITTFLIKPTIVTKLESVMSQKFENCYTQRSP